MIKKIEKLSKFLKTFNCERFFLPSEASLGGKRFSKCFLVSIDNRNFVKKYAWNQNLRFCLVWYRLGQKSSSDFLCLYIWHFIVSHFVLFPVSVWRPKIVNLWTIRSSDERYIKAGKTSAGLQWSAAKLLPRLNGKVRVQDFGLPITGVRGRSTWEFF